MQQSSPEPKRVRRTERFASAQPASPAPAQTGAPVRPAFSTPLSGLQDDTPIQRPEQRGPLRPQPKAPAAPVRRWVVIALIAAAAVCAVLALANTLMDAYVRRQERDREAAYQLVLTKHPVSYREMIERYAEQYNLQPAFVAAIILNESSYDRMAESSVGARGLMQVMEDTAAWIAERVSEPGYSFERMWDPESNIKFGCWYLGYLARMFGGDPVCVASAYHAGQGTVSRWLQNTAYSPDGRVLDPETMPEGPTRTYVRRVIRDYAIYDKIYWNAYNPADPPSAADRGAVAVPAPCAGR